MKKDEKEKANAEKAGMETEKSSEAAKPETINEDTMDGKQLEETGKAAAEAPTETRDQVKEIDRACE